MKVLITGGQGYIGQNLQRHLRTQGWDFTVLDTTEGSGTVHGSVTDALTVFELIHTMEPDVVVHLAALKSAPESVKQPDRYYHVNVGGTVNLMRAGVRRIVFASSAAVYGDGIGGFSEDDELEPVTPYGMTKAVCERVLSDCGCAGLSLRLFNVAGGVCRDEGPNLFAKIAASIRNDESMTLFPGVRDYVHVDDVCEAIIQGCLCEEPIQSLNICTGQETDTHDLPAMFSDLKYTPENRKREGDPDCVVGLNDLAMNVMGWHPQRTIDDIVEDTKQWCR